MKYIDIHSHLHFDSFDEERESVIERLHDSGGATISIGIDSLTSKREVEIAEANENIWACIGIHPDDSTERFEDNLTLFESLAKSKKVVAIGECGLDYSRLGDEPQKKKVLQKENFEAQIAFAVEHNLPVMIHTRDASEDTIALLESKKKEYGDALRGNAHFFTQGVDFARRYLAIDFTLSFTGVITFTHDYDDALQFAPLTMIHGETDAPFVAPVPNRGKRNEPSFVQYIYDQIALVRGEDKEIVRKQLIANAVRVFKMNGEEK